MKIYIYVLIYYPVVTSGLKKTQAPVPVLQKNTGSANKTPAPANRGFFLKFYHKHRYLIENNLKNFIVY